MSFIAKIPGSCLLQIRFVRIIIIWVDELTHTIEFALCFSISPGLEPTQNEKLAFGKEIKRSFWDEIDYDPCEEEHEY